MDPFRLYGNLLRSDGTNQLQRLLPGLQTDYIQPDERSLSDLVAYASSLAAEIRYYDSSGQATGDWRGFLDSLFDPSTNQVLAPPQLAALLASRNDWPPHLVLFLVFLNLFGNIQGDLNQLTTNHLRYFYQTVLGLPRRAAVPDDVYAIFQLAKNAAATLIPVGTLLAAGKDANGQPLSYATQNEILVSPAAVTGIKRLVAERDRSGHSRFFVADGFTPLEGASGYTFGRTQLDLDPGERFMSEAALGFAVAAPILNLAEGDRTVTLVAQLRSPTAAAVDSQGIGYALDVALTGAKGWLTPDSVQATLRPDEGSGQPTLSLTLTLGAALDAIVPFDSALHGPGLAIDRPVLRCLIHGASGLYDTLHGFIVETISLTVDVKGVRNLVVQSPDGPLNPAQPVALFGAQPRIGTPFYIGSNEILSKKLTTLALHMKWKSPPPDLYTYYRAYFDAIDNNLTDNFYDFFRVEVDLLYGGVFRQLLTNQLLFDAVATNPSTISAAPTAFDSAFAGIDYVPQPDLAAADSFDASSKFGFLRLVLTNPTQSDFSSYAQTVPFEAFGHNAFARRYANQAIALSQWTKAAGPKPELPNEPYTPTLSSISLDYTASVEMIPADLHAAETFLLFGPFGATRASDAVPAYVVPQIEGEASMFLGIGNIAVPTNLSLYFEIDVGTADVVPVLQPGQTQWSYLDSTDSWQALSSSAVLIDSTQGFQRPGVVTIGVPQQATLDHQALPSGLVWLRALISKPPESAARTSVVRTHATLAAFQPGSLQIAAYEDHLRSGLPAGTITRLAQRNASIKQVEQPDPSFGGRGGEDDTEYFRRCSERLRHRKRAVTAWDYERLVLEAFPEVFKVKCLPHTNADGLVKAGDTALVIVPNLIHTGSTSPLEPKAGDVLLGQISEYLLNSSSPFANVHVIRPVFERLRIEADVAFAPGRDPGYYSGVLNDDLKRFLSPWAYEDGEDILFGERIYRSEIQAFMEGRDYIDHVTTLNLYHSFAGPSRDGIGWMTIGLDFIIRPNPRPAISQMIIGDDLVVGRGVEFAETTQAHAILVSHPQHLIKAVTPDMEVCPGVTQLGIGYMTIDLDFKVQPETA